MDPGQIPDNRNRVAVSLYPAPQDTECLGLKRDAVYQRANPFRPVLLVHPVLPFTSGLSQSLSALPKEGVLRSSELKLLKPADNDLPR